MARSRNIKPGFFDNEILAELQPLIRLLFVGLWCISDREGRLEDRPKRIKKEILGYDDCNCDIMLTELESAGFIQRYVIDGAAYIQIINFVKHQKPHQNEPASTIPPNTFDQCTKRLLPKYEALATKVRSTRADSLIVIPDSLNTDSLNLIADSLNPIKPSCPSQKPRKAKAAPKNDSAMLFNEFWEQYPRKVAKQEALKAWEKLKPDKELFDEIMYALSAIKQTPQWTKDNGEFIPYPTTFIRQQRWKDEIAPAKEADDFFAMLHRAVEDRGG